jgi:tRNA modification GTPase
VGKSSLFNVLAGADRAIVTDVAGTTRDLVTERIDLGGLAITLVDTAGARDAVDVVERLGVERATRARAVADLVLVVVDGSEPLTREDSRLLEETSRRSRLIVANKSDRAIAPVGGPGGEAPKELHRVSALTGDGVDRLRAAIACALGGGESLRDCASISNARHIDLLRRARASLVEAHRSAGQGTTPEEFLLTDLQDARRCFDEVVGARTSEDVLDAVFSRFCIGK